MVNILNVAEKPSVAKSLVQVLSNLSHSPSSCTEGASVYNKIYCVANVKFPDPRSNSRNPNPPVSHNMVMTSVTGHIAGIDFKAPNNKWSGGCDDEGLFKAEIEEYVQAEKKLLESELEKQAKKATVLVLWLDCDREGEKIADEVRKICCRANSRLRNCVFRAKFSAVMPNEVTKALDTLGPVNQCLVDAVDARQEIDLRIGAAFTRFQSRRYQTKHNIQQTISYGPCQFPTLGFVVERWARIETFIPENFYTISFAMRDPEATGNRDIQFQWQRTRLYDRLCTLALYQNCLRARRAVVVSTAGRTNNRWRPVPLATVEMQKKASKYLRIGAEQTITAAQALYDRGIISYPRTETEKFKAEFDLQGALEAFR